MNCLVTAGPTYEPLDEVRRLTNFSTGRLGTELANALTDHGHHVTLLIGRQATLGGEQRAARVEIFTTTRDLRQRLKTHAGEPVEVVFHAAAVCDFAFGKVWRFAAHGKRTEVEAAKISTREGALWAQLRPTPKILPELRDWFPEARLVGWKYEVDGDRATALGRAEQQLAGSRTQACVVNGRAYGEGFALVTELGQVHLADDVALFAALEKWMERRERRGNQTG